MNGEEHYIKVGHVYNVCGYIIISILTGWFGDHRVHVQKVHQAQPSTIIYQWSACFPHLHAAF